MVVSGREKVCAPGSLLQRVTVPTLQAGRPKMRGGAGEHSAEPWGGGFGATRTRQGGRPRVNVRGSMFTGVHGTAYGFRFYGQVLDRTRVGV